MSNITIDLVTMRRLTPEESLPILVKQIEEQRKRIMALEAEVDQLNHDLADKEDASQIVIQSLFTAQAKRDQRIKELEAALKPSAKAADEIPDGLRSVLRIPEVGNFNKSVYLSATTDHLLAAKNAL